MNTEQMSAAAIAQVPVVFLAVTPGIESVLSIKGESEAQRARYARDAAAGISLLIGALMAIVAKDATPFLFAVVATAAMFFVYEKLITVQVGEK